MRLFADELKSELLPAVQKLQASNIAPVDLAQSAIGPGIAVYSRYKSIIQADGSELSVRDALKLINRELDNILNEHDSDIDTESSLCLMLYSQKGYNEWTFGDVNTLATAKNTSVDALARLGIVESGKGKVRVYERSELKPFSHGSSNCIWLITQQAVRAFENGGFSGIAEVFADISESDVSKIKKLCYQLFSIADKKKWTDEAIVYNSVITNWDDVNSYLEIPGAPGDKVGFDLERRDWVAPYGKGVVADFLVSGRIQTEGLPKDIRRRHELTLYFPNAADGAYRAPISTQSYLQTPHRADVDATYEKELHFWREEGASANARVSVNALEKECLILRTRTVCDVSGKIISAHYTVIDAPVLKWGRPDNEIYLFYFYNPTPNDPWLESERRAKMKFRTLRGAKRW